ncbi:MAG TPA: NAD-dependent epimerase/dehydratase family protein, partial [Chitinophagaceae bacterium]
MEQASTILITGGTGLIGTALTKALIGNGHKVIILTRDPTSKKNLPENTTYAAWDIEKQTLDLKALQQADYIVHLAGAGIADKRWTEKRKQEIVDSRVKSGELLVKTLKENQHKVKAFISASAIGWYGNDQKAPHQHSFIETDNAAD